MPWNGRVPILSRVGGVLIAALILTLVAAGHARAAVSYRVHGRVEPVYVPGLATTQKMTLVSGRGRTVATQAADSLGGLLFRNVTPGSGYRVHPYPAGTASPPVTVLTTRPAPPSTSIYNQTIPDSGYSYLTSPDGTQLAIDVHPPAQPAGEPVPSLPPGVGVPGQPQNRPVGGR